MINLYLFNQAILLLKDKISNLSRKDILNLALSFILLLTYSYFTLIAGGFKVDVDNLYFTTFFFLFPLIFFNYQSFKLLILIHGIISVLYLPTGRIWGRVNENIISSLMGTNFLESKDFFSLIPLRYYLEQIIFLVIIFYLLKLTKSIKLFKHNKSLMYVCMYVV